MFNGFKIFLGLLLLCGRNLRFGRPSYQKLPISKPTVKIFVVFAIVFNDNLFLELKSSWPLVC